MVRVCTACKSRDRYLIGSTFEEKDLTLDDCMSECWKRKKCKALAYRPSVVYQGNTTLPKCVLHAEAKTYQTLTDPLAVAYPQSVFKKGFYDN